MPQQSLTPEILVPRLGDTLVEKGLISQEELQHALQYQQDKRDEGQTILLGEALIDLKFLDRASLDQAVTEQILQLRAALQTYNQQLERRVQARTAELQEALRKVSELSQLKSNFIANVSHELRTPLTHIKGYIELFLSGSMGEVNEQQMNALLVMQRSSDRLERQIEDLIRFSVAAREEFTLALAPCELKNVFDGVISRSLPKATEKKIILLSQIPDHLPAVQADEEKLLWAIMQLVDNAIKFTNPDGQVVLSARLEPGFVNVAVTDTGIGIPSDRLHEIFEPFHQLDGSSTRRYGGTGLGLALVRQIIDRHGSEIRVLSNVNQGTRFEFLLAVAE